MGNNDDTDIDSDYVVDPNAQGSSDDSDDFGEYCPIQYTVRKTRVSNYNQTIFVLCI